MKQQVNHDGFMDEAFQEAFMAMNENLGGPFGAVVVMDGKIMGKGCNLVSSENDPTAHAEIVAIRNACKNAGTFNLEGAIIYSTCEPCPMCLSAIYWANIQSVYFAYTRDHAENIGFKDSHIYRELSLDPGERSIHFHQVAHPLTATLFPEWENKSDKIHY